MGAFVLRQPAFPRMEEARREACLHPRTTSQQTARSSQLANARCPYNQWTIRELKEIDSDAAEKRLRQWKEEVIQEYSHCFATCTEEADILTMLFVEKILSLRRRSGNLPASFLHNGKRTTRSTLSSKLKRAQAHRVRCRCRSGAPTWRNGRRRSFPIMKPFSVVASDTRPLAMLATTAGDAIYSVHCIWLA